ncbi:MAG TPA: tetratricopeptide repeat protein [Thermoanaerobaculia bacterium]|nr:tetratricopeptide repeat protein [Thermoanaerobaculia bacterium]
MSERDKDLLRQAAGQAHERVSSHFREIDRIVALLGELLQQSAPERRLLIETQPRLQGLKLCELLQTRARQVWSSDPVAAVEFAELAVAVADRLDTEHYGSQVVENVRALAWAHLGNAHRIASDLRRAEEDLRTAEEHYRLAGEDAYTEAQFLSFKASLRNAQGQFEDAAMLLDQALAIYREARDRHLQGKMLIKKGAAFGYAGRFKEASRLVRRGLSRIDLMEDPRLLVAARHNLIWYLEEAGRHQEALTALEETRSLYLELGEPSHRVRLRWLEGKIFRGLDRLDEAESTLREARDAFIERGIGFDAALVSLDLAMVYARRGDTGEMKRLATEMIPIFESRDVHQEALAALLLFRQAAETEGATLGLLERMATYLQRARRNPELRFTADPG